MKIVAMDTAGAQGGVALLAGDVPLASDRFSEPSGHVAALPARLHALLGQVGWRLAEVELLVVTHGPGSFTGVRIALGLAKGIHLAQGTPLVGVETLALAAAGSGANAGPVTALLDARRQELFVGRYRLDGADRPHALAPPRIMTPATLAEALAGAEEPPLLTGDGLATWGALLEERLGNRYRATDPSLWLPDPVRLGRLGWQRLRERGADDAATLEPLYLRRSEAEENRARQLTQTGAA